jgi:hypothetical protein
MKLAGLGEGEYDLIWCQGIEIEIAPLPLFEDWGHFTRVGSVRNIHNYDAY